MLVFWWSQVNCWWHAQQIGGDVQISWQAFGVLKFLAGGNEHWEAWLSFLKIGRSIQRKAGFVAQVVFESA